MTRTAHASTQDARSRAFWRAAVLGGLIGGAVFMMAEMLMVMLIGQSPWAPPRMIAAMVLGDEVLPPPATFDAGVLATAMMIHFPLSILYGIVIGWIVQRMSRTGALLAGAAIGLAIYLINFYGIASFAFEWFAMARNWVSLVTHVLFGLVTAWAFVALSRHAVTEPGGSRRA